MLVADRSSFVFKVKGPLGEANLNENVYSPLLDVLADRKPKSLGQLEDALNRSGVQFAQMVQAVLVLAGQGTICSVQEDAVTSKARKACEKLNAMVLARARTSGEINYLASPVTGGGVTTGRFPQLFMLAAQNGLKRPEDWADFVWKIVAGQGQKVVKEGKTLESSEENLAEIVSQANAFVAKQLPVLKDLQIA